MKLILEHDDLEPLIRRVVAETVGSMRVDAPAAQPAKLLFSEKHAADVLGVSVYFLKENRQHGRIRSHTAKKPILYTWQQIEDIRDWLATRSEHEPH